jgi:hypothetical protein
MKSFLLAALMLFSINELNAQTFAYSFSGSLSQSESEKFRAEVLKIPSILTFELKTKPDLNKGEIILSVDPMDNRGETDHPFSPADLKAILITYSLEPIEFRQIK